MQKRKIKTKSMTASNVVVGAFDLCYSIMMWAHTIFNAANNDWNLMVSSTIIIIISRIPDPRYIYRPIEVDEPPWQCTIVLIFHIETYFAHTHTHTRWLLNVCANMYIRFQNPAVVKYLVVYWKPHMISVVINSIMNYILFAQWWHW